jgi:hypothetical protein
VLIVGGLLSDPAPQDSTDQTTPQAPQATTEQTPAKAAPTTAKPAREAPGIGTKVRDGKFEFTVRKVECGKSRIGSTDFGTTAQGQFCFVYP